MCTTIKYKGCMGRNFDYEISYKETPRTYNKEKYKIQGIVADINEYPLFYDAMNEHGLCMAGLNFENNAYYYNDELEDKNNIAPWEIIPKVLGNCKTVTEAKEYLQNVRIINKPFNEELPNTPLHWFICDKKSSIVFEQTQTEGAKIYIDLFDALTNNPPFTSQVQSKRALTDHSVGTFMKGMFTGENKTRGTETWGLVGGLTSQERFARITYYKKKLLATTDKFNPVIETFHLLDTVKQIYGATPVNDKFEYTIYEIVYDMENMKIYWKKYDDLNMTEVRGI